MSKALEFLKAEATVGENGTAHLTQKNYVAFMAERGVTKEVLEATNAAHQELVNGLYRYNAERLKKAIPEAKKAGQDPYKTKVKTVVNIPQGNITLETQAAKVYPVPNQDTKVTKTCVSHLTINQERLIDRDMMADMEEQFRKELGIK